MGNVPTLLDALREFAEALTANYAVAELNPAQAEDQLKGPTQRLLAQVGEAIDLDVVRRTEAPAGTGRRAPHPRPLLAWVP